MIKEFIKNIPIRLKQSLCIHDFQLKKETTFVKKISMLPFEFIHDKYKCNKCGLLKHYVITLSPDSTFTPRMHLVESPGLKQELFYATVIFKLEPDERGALYQEPKNP